VRSELRRDLWSIEERMVGQEESVDALGRDLRDELEKATAALDRRLQWLERHVRASAGAITASLDPDPELVELARRAERGRLLEKQLLDRTARSVAAGTVVAWETWQQQWHAQCLEALAVSRRITDTEPEDAGLHVVPAFRAARQELARLEERRDRVQAAAKRAEQHLTRDDTLRRQHAAAIDRGRDAWTTLTTRLRTRLVEAIDKGHLLPVWFATVLGMSPPADAGDWIEAGTELLAYRATYGITDLVVALGPAPEPSETRRCSWHSRLTNRFRRYH
jgi:hypothetical protein